MTLNDGGSCTSQITLTPIEQPTLNLQGSWTQCSGVHRIGLTTPRHPTTYLIVHYNADWGDGQTSDDIPYGSAFEHNYGTQGSYSVAVEAQLGSCTNSTTVDVFMGSAPDAPALNVPPSTCPDGELSFSWDNLEQLPLVNPFGRRLSMGPSPLGSSKSPRKRRSNGILTTPRNAWTHWPPTPSMQRS